MAYRYKLYYFNSRGNGELPRQIFAVAGVEYEDIRIEKDDWPEKKKQVPFGQVPVLEVDGVQLPQSSAISRFLARKFGLAGKTPFDEAMVDAVYDQIKDFLAALRPYSTVLYGFKQGDLDQLYKEVAIPARDKHLSIFVKILKENKSGYLVGDSITYTDLYLSEVLSNPKMTPDFLEPFPEITAFIKKVRSNERLKKWIETRPVTER